jgi:hypothetical protein
MSEATQQNDMAKKRVVYELPGMHAVTVRRDVEYQGANSAGLAMDIYYPPDAKTGSRIPAVVFVTGYPDPGFQKVVGCKQKEMGSYVSWAQLAAASGLVAFTYTNSAPAEDIRALLQYVRENDASLGIDEKRIGIWACSGNVPNALSLLMREQSDPLKCAVLCYGFMLDLEGSAAVAKAARQWGFANPCMGKSVEDLAQDLPLFIARAGQDESPQLNLSIDSFVAKALICNLPITLVNHAVAPHAFDLMHHSEATCEIIREILAFMKFHLLA